MDKNPVKNKYMVLIKSRRMAMYCCNQKYYVSGIAWSRYQEQEKLDHNFGWKNIKILLFLYHQILLISWAYGPDIAGKWRGPEFCIFVWMEGIKSYGAWIWSKTCHFHGCRWKKGHKNNLQLMLARPAMRPLKWIEPHESLWTFPKEPP